MDQVETRKWSVQAQSPKAASAKPQGRKRKAYDAYIKTRGTLRRQLSANCGHQEATTKARTTKQKTIRRASPEDLKASAETPWSTPQGHEDVLFDMSEDSFTADANQLEENLKQRLKQRLASGLKNWRCTQSKVDVTRYAYDDRRKGGEHKGKLITPIKMLIKKVRELGTMASRVRRITLVLRGPFAR